ncbi:MAG: STAS domain-containing protein [Phycisphaerales bacterium]|nr:STAS domain-containing protein [Phycisphaerales bacterium]
MAVQSEEYNQICVLKLEGEFSGEDVATARKTVEQVIEQKQIVDFVVDMEKTTFIDSDGLESLLWMKSRCEELFGQLKLARLDENCRKIMEVTRLDHRLESHDNLELALKAMQ